MYKYANKLIGIINNVNSVRINNCIVVTIDKSRSFSTGNLTLNPDEVMFFMNISF